VLLVPSLTDDEQAVSPPDSKLCIPMFPMDHCSRSCRVSLPVRKEFDQTVETGEGALLSEMERICTGESAGHGGEHNKTFQSYFRLTYSYKQEDISVITN
jgi:hypothetical protein